MKDLNPELYLAANTQFRSLPRFELIPQDQQKKVSTFLMASVQLTFAALQGIWLYIKSGPMIGRKQPFRY